MRGPDAPQARGDEQRDAARERAHFPLPNNGFTAPYLRCSPYIYTAKRVSAARSDARAVRHARVVDDQEGCAAAGDAAGFEARAQAEGAVEAGVEVAQVVVEGGAVGQHHPAVRGRRDHRRYGGGIRLALSPRPPHTNRNTQGDDPRDLGRPPPYALFGGGGAPRRPRGGDG